MELTVRRERWPLRKPFRTAHGAQAEVGVVVATLRDGPASGRGEAVGVHYLGESPETILRQVDAVRSLIETGLPRGELAEHLPPGGARNALDCALWDLEAKQSGRSVWDLAGLDPRPVETVYTIGLDTLDAMARDAGASTERILKVKLDADRPLERLSAVRAARPDARLVVDANQGFRAADLPNLLAGMAALSVEMVEQPLPPGDDLALAGLASPVPLCADESCQTSADIPALVGRYQMVNIKLDKAGGLTEALAMLDLAHRLGLRTMVGCMAATSLSMAPAFVVASQAEYVDIDGPLLLARDREAGLHYDRGRVQPPSSRLWG